MDTETTMATGIRIADTSAQLDAACKRLLSEKILLAHIMRSCLVEYKDCTAEEIAEKYIEGNPQVAEIPVHMDETSSVIAGMNTEDASLMEGRIFYDVRFHALAPTSDELIRLIVNVEAQAKYDVPYPIIKRGLYYCSRMISAQHGIEFTESHYEKIKKVYSVWICMNPTKKRENTINRYRIVEDHLVGNVTEPIKNYDLLSVIMIHLGDPDNCDGILRLLSVLFSKEIEYGKKKEILENEFSIPMSQKIEQEVSQMCNLGEYIAQEAMEKGVAKGRAEEREKSTDRMSRLIARLYETSRESELREVAQNPDKLNTLCAEFGIN